jgi:hypothetical protein
LKPASKETPGGRAGALIVPSLFAGFGGRPSQLELAGNTINDEILVDSESLSLAAMTVSENCSVSILLPNPMFTILRLAGSTSTENESASHKHRTAAIQLHNAVRSHYAKQCSMTPKNCMSGIGIAANRVQTLPGKGWSGLLVSMARRNHGGGV